MTFRKKLAALLLPLLAVGMAAGQTPGIKYDKIGIYDLKALHAIPLNPETVSKKTEGGIVYEKVRFNSVDYNNKTIRIFAILSYKEGAQKLPGLMILERFQAKPWQVPAINNYFAISVAPPDGNQDPAADKSVGGPRYEQPFSLDDQFRDNPNQSYVYQHTVALLRALDYLETRREVELSRTVVSGYSWPGLMITHLHALDDRPIAYVCIHGVGYYADPQGNSGDSPALYSRKMYEMYGSGVYAPYGTKPIYVGVALDDYFTKLDAVMEFYNNLKSPKAFAYVPNRHHTWTSRQEFNSDLPSWHTYWQGTSTEKPSTISEGTVSTEGGKVVYTAKVESAEPLTWSEVLVSYGKPGSWMGRTWHSVPLVKTGDSYRAEIPVYDPSVPMYVVGQIGTAKHHAAGNGIQFVEPAKIGISAASATYSNVLFDPSLKDDIYLRTGVPTWSSDSGDGKGSVILKPNEGSAVMFQNTEPKMWKGGKEFRVWIKGDGKAGALSAYFAFDNNYYLDKEVKSFTKIDIVPEGGTMWTGWKEVVIPLVKISNLDRVTTLFFEPGDHTFQMGTVSWK